MECTQTTTTRRELRLAEKRARRRRFRPQRANSATAMMVTVGLTAALLGAGASQAYSDHRLRSAHDAVAAAVAHDRANRVRSDHADGARLESIAIAFATVRRSEAVVLARAAVAQATSTRASSAPDVTPETLTPLDEALVNLAALIEAAPPAPVPLATRTTDSDVDGTADATTPMSTTGAVAIAARDLAAADADADDTATSDSTAASTAGGVAGAAVAGATTAVSLDAVDLDVSAQLLVAAQLVTELSLQVEAVADANVAAAAQVAAEAAAAESAAEAARVAEAAARAAVARKVAAVEDAPNGAIPADLLCAVSFDSSVLLRCDAARALDQLAVAYRDAFGRNPRLVSSYRSLEDQVSVRLARGGLAAMPGSSNHGRGVAVDLANFGSLGQFSAPGYLWMKEHAREFGWHHPAIMEPGGGGPQEPWHWEFETD